MPLSRRGDEGFYRQSVPSISSLFPSLGNTFVFRPRSSFLIFISLWSFLTSVVYHRSILKMMIKLPDRTSGCSRWLFRFNLVGVLAFRLSTLSFLIFLLLRQPVASGHPRFGQTFGVGAIIAVWLLPFFLTCVAVSSVRDFDDINLWTHATRNNSYVCKRNLTSGFVCAETSR